MYNDMALACRTSAVTVNFCCDCDYPIMWHNLCTLSVQLVRQLVRIICNVRATLVKSASNAVPQAQLAP